MEQYLELWNKTKLYLKEELLPEVYDDTFPYIDKIAKVENNYIYMIVPDVLFKHRIEKNFINIINDFAKKITDPTMGFKFIDKKSAEKIIEEQQNKKNDSPIITQNRVLSSLYTFQSFEVGESNRLAFFAALKVAESSEKVYNPLYIFGGVGLGKTHLMSAIGNHILDHNINANVVYTSSQKFAEDYFLVTRDKTGEKIKDFYVKYNSADVLLVDDIQFLENKQTTQEEFFKIFDTLVNNNKQIVITSDKPANELKNVMDRLKSRFNWGLTINIKQPDINLRVNVLKNKLSSMIPDPNVVSDEVLVLLANHFDNNIRDLEGALHTFINYCSITGDPYDENSFYAALESILPKNTLVKDQTIDRILNLKEIVANYFKITIEDIDSSNRKAQFVYARQIIMYILKNYYNIALEVIGKNMGDRNHSTVSHGIDKITSSIKKDIMIKEDVNKILSRLEA